MHTRCADAPAAARAGSHQDLGAWQAAVELAVECYLRTAGFPWTERFGLVAGIRRAAAAAVAQIVEAHGGTPGEPHPSGRSTPACGETWSRHLRAARGAVRELEAHFARAATLGYLDAESHARARALCDRVSRAVAELAGDAAPQGHVGARVPVPGGGSSEAVIQ